MSEIGESSSGASGKKPSEPDICEKLREEIDEILNRNKHEFEGKGRHGLVHRFRELLSNMEKQIMSNADIDNPAESQRLWQTHKEQIDGGQRQLKKRLEDLDKNNCGDPPPGVWSWVDRPVPTLQERRTQLGLQKAVSTTAKVGTGVAAGYIIYRVIRFLPSLFPPLWGTIPANLAIP